MANQKIISRQSTEATGPEPFWSSFAADFDRQYIYHEGNAWMGRMGTYLGTHSLWVLLAYRFGRALKARPVPLLNPLLWIVFRVWEFLARAATGITLHIDARIAPGVLIGHFGAIYIGPGVEIGRNCSLGQTCIISGDGSWPDTPAPVIGERVYMAPGSKVLGPVTIGDDASLGANSVVLSDVPPSATMVGNPASVINLNGSAKFLRLRER